MIKINESIFFTLNIIAINLAMVTAAEPQPHLSPSETPKVSMRIIEHSWSSRAKKLTPIIIEWSVHIIEFAPQIPEDQDAEKSVVADTTSKSRLSIDGGKMHFQIAGERPLGSGKVGRHDYEESFDGNVSAHLSLPTDKYNYHRAYIYDKKYCDAAAMTYCKPVVWMYFPFESFSEIEFHSLAISSAKEKVDGRDCVRLERRVSDYVVSYILDPSFDFRITKFTIKEMGVLKFELKCEYCVDSGDHLPSKWQITEWDHNGVPKRIEEHEVIEKQLNPSFRDNEFSIEFPVGTFVSDQRPESGLGRTGAYDYIVMQDGSHRRVTWDERFADYNELLKTPSGTARGKNQTKELPPARPPAE